MKCQILCSEKNKKIIINLLSVELAQRVVKVNLLPQISVTMFLRELHTIGRFPPYFARETYSPF